MLGTLIVIAIIGLVVSYLEIDAKMKNLAYIILGIAVLVVLLPLVGISLPLR
jgi:hypothetical protein